MLLADMPSVTLVQSIGNLLHEVFGGDYPVDPLAWHQIAARAAIIYLGGLIVVRIGKSRLISRTTSLDVILGFIPGFVRNRRRSLGFDGHRLPVARFRHAVQGKFGTSRGRRPHSPRPDETFTHFRP